MINWWIVAFLPIVVPAIDTLVKRRIHTELYMQSMKDKIGIFSN